MGEGDNSITIRVNLDTSEIKNVGPEIKQATSSFTKSAKEGFDGVSKSASGIFKNIGKVASSVAKGGLGLVEKSFGTITKAGRGLAGLIGGALSRGIGLFRKSAGDSAKPLELSFKSLMSTARRLIPMMLGVRGVFSALQKGASSFLASNKQLQNQLSAVWTAIGNVIGPVITMLVNLLSTLVSYLISFLHLIGLSSMSASEAAKKTKGAAGSMQKSLMQFDELNKLQDNSGGGGAGSLIDMQMPEVLKKLGDAIKQLMADLKLTWKQAWDENGRGEKMMAALKQLLIDIIDLMAEFILALDRAWMNADNGKKIFADIMEIITNLATGFDTIVKAFTEWVKNTDWLNIIVEDVRKIFDAVNETSVIWREKIAPILASKVAPLMNTISRGFHNILLDIEKIVRGINEGLSSAEGTAMINALADLAIAWTAMKLAFVDMILGIIANIDWTSLAAGITRIANGAKGIMESLTKLFENEQVRTALAKIFDIAWTVISTAFEAISSAITNIVNKINEADWEGFNNWLDKLETSVELGIEEIKPVWNGSGDENSAKGAIATALAGALSFLTVQTVTGSTGAAMLAATIGTTGILSLLGVEPEDGGLSSSVALDKVLDVAEIALAAVGFAKGGIGGAVAGWAISTTLKPVIDGAIEAGFGTGSFDFSAFLDNIIQFLNESPGVAGAIAGGLVFSKSGNLLYTAIAATAAIALSASIGMDTENGTPTLDATKFWAIIAAAVIGAIAGAILIKGPYGAIIGVTISMAVFLMLNDIIIAKDNLRAEKVADEARETARADAGVFFDEYEKEFEELGYSESQILTFKQNFENIAVAENGGTEMAKKYIEGWINGLKEGKTPEEIYKDIYGSSGESAGNAGEEAAEIFRTNFEGKLRAQVGSSTEIDSWLAEYTRIYQEQGQTAADEYANSIIAGLGAKGEELKNAGKEGGAAVAEGVNEAAASNIEFSEDAEQEAANNLLVLASKIQNRQEAEDVGKGIVSGLLHGMSLELPNLVTGLEEGIKTVLGAADTVYTNWKDTTFTTNRDTFLSELTTWINGTFYLGVTTSVSAVITIVQQSIDSFATNSETRIANMGASISGTFTGLASAARGWGRDIGSQIAYGMMDTIGMVASAASRIADIIYRYLHFSEPDVGPLKDFHTFMPDMMNLMAQGITQNADKPESAIDKVAQGMADSMSLLGQLNGISNNVDFMMPAMATGSIMPYSVGMSRTETKESQRSDLYDTLVSAFTEALNGQRPIEANVFLDGKQIADSTTKWQRRADRAGGK